jgi:UDP-glucose 4-epimerase
MEYSIKILLTGSSGFIGGRFFQDYKGTYDIHCVSLRTTSPAQVDFSEIDAVVHCAALVHQMKGAPEEEYFKINRDLTVELAEKAKAAGVKHFIFLSTAHVFSDSGVLDHTVRFDPKSPCNSKEPYGRSKLAAEKELLKFAEASFVVSIIRPPMVYGEGAKGNLVRMSNLLRKFPIAPFNFRKNKRSLIYVGNLISFINVIIKYKRSGIFLPQDEKPLSIFELAHIINEAQKTKTRLINPTLFLRIPLFYFKRKIYLSLFGSLALHTKEQDEQIGFKRPFSTNEGVLKMIESGSNT